MGLGLRASKWSSKEQRRKSFVLRGRVDGGSLAQPAPSNGGDAASASTGTALRRFRIQTGWARIRGARGVHARQPSGTLSAELAERRDVRQLKEACRLTRGGRARLLTRLRERTGETNSASRGVAQNSCQRSHREGGGLRSSLHLAAPGDEDRLGRAEYALHKLPPTVSDLPAPPLRSRPRAPTRAASIDNEVNDAIEEFAG